MKILNAYALRPLGWILCLTLAAIGLIRHFWPSHVGLFLYADHCLGFGILRDTAGSTELAGSVITPVSLGAAALLFMLLEEQPRRL